MPDYGPKTYNCLSGCGERFKVNPVWDRAPMEAEAENFAPVIIATIASSGNYITVGNESWPNKENKAVIKSIETGYINKIEGSIEIVDEDGGALSLFLDNVEKCAPKFQLGSTKLVYQIGWVYTRCDGSQGMILSPKMTNAIFSIETNLSGGLIRFIVKFAVAPALVENTRENKTFGEETGGKQMHLEDAIMQLAELCPTINVEFGYYDRKGELIKGLRKLQWLTTKGVVLGGPKAAWTSKRLNKFDVIAEWIGTSRIKDGDKDKGAVLVNDPARPNTVMVLMDPNPEDQLIINNEDTTRASSRHLGTFIVNGGKCSNVLEFSPTFNIVNSQAQQSSGANAKGGIATDSELIENEKTPSEKRQCINSGIQQTITPNSQIEFVAGPEAFSETNKSQLAHIRANRIFEIQGNALEAELRIVGSTYPSFYSYEAIAASLSIVVISPFTIRGGKAGRDCGDFLKKADCHPFFSNRKWILLGVNHSVREGSFVTTLKVQLYTTGFELPWGEPFGGDPEGATLTSC